MPALTKIQDSFAWGMLAKGSLLPSSEVYYGGVASAVNYIIGADKKLHFRPGTTVLIDGFPTNEFPPATTFSNMLVAETLVGEVILVWYLTTENKWLISGCHTDGSKTYSLLTSLNDADVNIYATGLKFLVTCVSGHFTFEYGDAALVPVPYYFNPHQATNVPLPYHRPLPITPTLPLATLNLELLVSDFHDTQFFLPAPTLPNRYRTFQTDYKNYVVLFYTEHDDTTTYVYDKWLGDVIYLPVEGGGMNGLPGIAPALVFDGDGGIFSEYPLQLTHDEEFSQVSDLIFNRSVFAQHTTYPPRAIVFQNRVYMYGLPSRPNDVYGTVISQFNNFNTLIIGDPINGVIDVTQRQFPVSRLFSGRQLQLFTKSEQQTTVQNSDGISSSNFYLKSQTKISFYEIDPVMLGESTFFIGGDQQSVYRFVETGGVESSFIAIPVTEYLDTLINNPIKMVAMTNAVTNSYHVLIFNAYVPGSAGTTCAVLTFQPETGSENAAYGWTQWTFPFPIFSVATDGNKLYIVYYIANALDPDSMFTLCILDPTNENCFSDGTFIVPNVSSQVDISSWMDSKEVVAYRLDVNGNPFQYEVLDTGITRRLWPSDGEQSSFGVQIIGQITTLPVNESEETFFQFKKAQHFYVGYYNTFQLKVNGKEVPFYEFNTAINSQISVEFLTGFYTTEVTQQVGYNVSATILHTAPFSCTITAVGTIASYLGS